MYAFRFQEASEDRRLIRREDVRLWDGLRLLCTHKRLLFSVVQILTAGISFGVVAAFAYVLLHERAKRDGREQGWDLTLCRTAMAVGAIAMYYLSGPLISKLGAYAIMTLSLGSLSLMFFTYSLVYYGTTPLVALTGMLVAEFLRGGTFAILWATVMVYIDSISPSGSNSTMVSARCCFGLVVSCRLTSLCFLCFVDDDNGIHFQRAWSHPWSPVRGFLGGQYCGWVR